MDHCNFLKIVDEPEPDTLNHDNGTAANGLSSNGFNANPDTSGIPVTSLDWMPTSTVSSNVIPAGLQGILMGQGSGKMFEAGGFQSHMSGYGPSDVEFSDPGPSDRPTPSTTPSDGRGNLQPAQGRNGHSGRSSFETSPASSHRHTVQPDHRVQHNNMFTGAEYTGIGPIGTTGLTNAHTYGMPETPGRDFTATGGWEMNGQGLTPVGEGVFRELMGMGPMEMGWDGSS